MKETAANICAMSDPLKNYRQLIVRVDALCSAIAESLGDQITCSAGCSSCCTSISVFPVEADVMRDALERRPPQSAKKIRRIVSEHNAGKRCPLLHHDYCLLYEARPIICRTHGLPIVYSSDGLHKSDCCPRNMNGITSITGSSVVDLDKLNTTLVAVNSIYLLQDVRTERPVRLTIAEALAPQ